MDIQEILSKSVITDDFLRKDKVPNYLESKRQIKKAKRLQRSLTKGNKWYNMPATEQTPEIKNDLTIMKLCSALYPKLYYKKNDWKELPKYYQIGTVMDNPFDFYSARLTKKQRKQTICEQIIADKDFQEHFNKKYQEMKDYEEQQKFKKYRGKHRSKKSKNT